MIITLGALAKIYFSHICIRFFSSGRLPYTIGKSIDDYSAQVDYTFSIEIVEIPYTEGLFIDYRHFDAVIFLVLFLRVFAITLCFQANITPRYEYGFGLSYTTFDYSDLSVSGSVPNTAPPSGPGSSLDPS